MARVVIDIPDDNKRDIYWVKGKRVANLIGEYKVLAVLPEGHGDLIDRDETMSIWGNKYFYQGVPLEHYIDEVPAIIPADEEGSDESSN